MKSTLDLWDLADKKVYIKLDRKCVNDFFNYVVGYAGSERVLANLLGIKRVYNIWYYKTKSLFVPLKLIKKILDILHQEKRIEFTKNIEANLEELRFGYGKGKPIRKPKIPIRFSPTLSRIAGHLVGDGGIRMTKGDYPVYYTNRCDLLIKQFKEDVLNIFGDIDFYHYQYHGNRNKDLKMIRFPSIVGIILMKFFGPMTGDSKHVPYIIINSDNNSKALFLRALFDDEGCVSSHRVVLMMSNKIVVETVRKMLNSFGIKSGKIRIIDDKNGKLDTN